MEALAFGTQATGMQAAGMQAFTHHDSGLKQRVDGDQYCTPSWSPSLLLIPLPVFQLIFWLWPRFSKQ